VNFIVLQQLGIATLLGALIGLERERRHQLEHKNERNGDTFGGIRTFALIGLMGALSYLLSSYSIVIFGIIASALLILIISSYVMIGRKYNNFGITTEVASILVFMTGILSGMGLYVEATMVALVVLGFLLLKTPLHEWAGRIKWQEMISTLEFMIIAFVILPLLPNKEFGPYGFFNPYLIWLLVVFISGISFASYLAIKLMGPKKGLVLTGFLAGFISTTALSVSISNQSKKNNKYIGPYLSAITIAVAAMFLRMMLEVFILNQDLLVHVMIPLLSMTIVSFLIAIFVMEKNANGGNILNKHIMELKSPFSLLPALKFGGLFALLILVLKFAMANIGANSVYLVSTIFGFFDVDAVTISMSSLVKSEVTVHAAVIAIALGGIMNTLLKIGIFFVFADRKLAKNVAWMTILVSIVGALSLFFL